MFEIFGIVRRVTEVTLSGMNTRRRCYLELQIFNYIQFCRGVNAAYRVGSVAKLNIQLRIFGSNQQMCGDPSPTADFLYPRLIT